LGEHKGHQNRSEAFVAAVGTSAESEGTSIVGCANLQPQAKAWLTSSRRCIPSGEYPLPRAAHYYNSGTLTVCKKEPSLSNAQKATFTSGNFFLKRDGSRPIWWC